jgi:predicted SAM-dependent methyltransferase
MAGFISLTKDMINQTKAFARALLWLFNKSPFPSKDRGIFLHIGCGEIDIPGFINIDARPLKHVHLLKRDISKLPFKSNSVTFIYMSHILEHIPTNRLAIIFKEMHRVLKPETGVLRISVPDFDKLVGIYLDNQRDLPLILSPLLGGQDYKFNYHYSVFNKEYLSVLCKNAGFRFVNEWDPNNCLYHDFEDWASLPININGSNVFISLNLECVK